ncbi:hypothetical protein QJS04_geneDACA009412 [Acorus gramineus]|uniref:Spindle and kinetochore-associated protein 3 n=1 Tax=Acorus gramineus TaxID=55184 RepID=A0AAV9AHE2_ACOGR|nr:hypothetical protein QJS04_geneDACA009412 [Acorus gramineus]
MLCTSLPVPPLSFSIFFLFLSFYSFFSLDGKKMESSIKAFSKTLASMCDHIQISCDSLLDSVRRTPLPRESATATFLRCLDRRSSSAGADLEVLESMAFGTVSFEELLGHCNEVYKKNQSDLSEVEQRLEELGFGNS